MWAGGTGIAVFQSEKLSKVTYSVKSLDDLMRFTSFEVARRMH
jgi:hypothetical protein